ncbi:hypothetical protein [Absidia glauca]|uniref:Protein kinase domain-containing protein n=1 Tax=Absidia glauca TaxID=4829 RepID=A0A163JDE6_ABSGL|nr:hypothetical protein [Absidia glauca]
MTRPEIKEQIRSGIYDDDQEFWGSVSSEVKDLINGLLTVDPAQRMGVNEARNHQWFQDGVEDLRMDVQDLDDGDVELLRHYDTMPSLPTTPS